MDDDPKEYGDAPYGTALMMRRQSVMSQTRVIEAQNEPPGLPLAKTCPGDAAVSSRASRSYGQRVVLSLVLLVCMVSIWRPWVGIGQAEDTAVTVEIISTPSLEHLRPPMDLARVTLVALLHGKPLSQGHMQVQLMAPPRTTVLAPDFPGVEGAPLLAFDSDLIDGVVTLQYRFPRRGTYTFDLELSHVPGGPVFPPTSLRKTVRICENSVMLRQSWLLVGLFVLGVITGGLVARFAAARAKRRGCTILGLLVLCCGALAPSS